MTYFEKPLMTTEQARLFLDERGIHEVDEYKTSVKVRGRWALVRTKSYDSSAWDDEVCCYDLQSNVLVAEAWDSIPYKSSPFIPNNEKKTSDALGTLTKEYLKEYPEPLEGLCLVAIEGDCSKYGMSDTTEVLTFDLEHEDLVRQFMRAQLENQLQSCFLGMKAKKSDDMYKGKAGHIIGNLYELAHAMVEAGVFPSKYHTRTTWELTFLDYVEDTERYHPYKILNKEAVDTEEYFEAATYIHKCESCGKEFEETDWLPYPGMLPQTDCIKCISDEEGITPEQEQMAEDSLNHLRSLLAKEEGDE